MAVDERLAQRVRDCLAQDPDVADVTERRMFGGLAFLVGGRMAVAASDAGLLVRADPESGERLLDGDRVAPMVMRGRPMSGWLRVAPSAIRTSTQLRRFVRLGVDRVRTLEPSAES